jgi:hypothetical protein
MNNKLELYGYASDMHNKNLKSIGLLQCTKYCGKPFDKLIMCFV